jgi:invasion protein IalB
MQGFYRVAVVALGLNISLLASAAIGASANGDQPDAPATAPPPSAPAAQDQSKAPAITEQKYGEWALQCTSDKSMNPPCQIIYRLASADQKQIATVISMAKASGDAVGMQMALPLGFAIQSGVKIEFGPKFSTMAAVSRCTVQGCLIEGMAPQNMLAAMLKEKSGKITVRMMQGNEIALPVNLDGFAQAYQAMSAKM